MKIILAFLIITSTLFASESFYTIKYQILEKIFKNISMYEEMILWSDDKHLQDEFARNKTFKVASNCQDASLVIIEDKKDIPKSCLDKAVFVLDYALLKEIPQSFGAMFWKKARPNIVIIRPRANAKNIFVSQTLNSYLEDEIW